MLPSALLLVPFFFAPLAIMLVYSFHRFLPGGRQEPAFILDNYWRFVSDPFYRSILGDTLLMGAAVAGLALLLSYPLAYTLARSRSRWKGLLTVIVLIPLMTSVVVRSYGWMILLSSNGVVNTLLAALQLPRTQLMFNFTGTIIGLTEVLMPFMVLTLSGVIQQIDPDLEDSVRSLGGRSWHVFRDVILPLSLPGIAGDRTSAPLPRTLSSLPGCCLSCTTACIASRSSSLEFAHGSGSSNAVDATYFWMVFSTSVNGLSFWCGQKP